MTHAFFSHLHYDHCMDYARLVLQRWDMGADRIPDLEVYGPAPIGRMTSLLFGDDGVYGPDIRARTEHRSSLDVFEARGGHLPRKRPQPRVTEVRCMRARSSRAACGNHEDNARMAQEAGVKTLVLTHLLPQIDRPGIRDRARDPARVRRPGDLGRGPDADRC